MDTKKAHKIVTEAGFKRSANLYFTNMSRWVKLVPELEEAMDFLHDRCSYEMIWKEDDERQDSECEKQNDNPSVSPNPRFRPSQVKKITEWAEEAGTSQATMYRAAIDHTAASGNFDPKEHRNA